MKKSTGIMLSSVLVLSLLAGCSSKSTSEPSAAAPTASANSQSSESAAPATPAPTKLKEVTIHVTSMYADHKDAFAKMDAMFMEKYPNIKVVNDVLPLDQYLTTFKTKLNAGDGIDVYQLWTGDIKGFLDKGFVADISGLEAFSNIDPSVVDQVTIDKKQYSLPMGMNLAGVVYNMDIFDKYSLKVPTNWTEFLNVNETLKKNGQTPMVMPGKDVAAAQMFLVAAFSSSIYAKDPEFEKRMVENKQTFAGSPWEDILNKQKEMIDKKYYQSGILGTAVTEAYQMMATGKVAMSIGGDWDLDGIRKISPDLRLGFFPLPTNAVGEEAYMPAAVGPVWLVAGSSKAVDESKLYLNFMATQEATDLAWPTGISVFKNVKTKVDPAIAELQKNMPKTTPFAGTGWPAGLYGGTFMKTIQEFVSGQKNTKQFVDTMDKAWKDAATK